MSLKNCLGPIIRPKPQAAGNGRRQPYKSSSSNIVKLPEKSPIPSLSESPNTHRTDHLFFPITIKFVFFDKMCTHLQGESFYAQNPFKSYRTLFLRGPIQQMFLDISELVLRFTVQTHSILIQIHSLFKPLTWYTKKKPNLKWGTYCRLSSLTERRSF